MPNFEFLDDETLTDNLDDRQGGRLLRILETVGEKAPSELDLTICLVRLLNKIVKDGANLDLFQELTSKLEEKYVKS